ncbi:MAG: 6-pyruvoyl-tetrahydropterin synthase-related protein, partial [Candidatus Sumerlaeota bacterium]|nr:6-pyruvoyl-tetrahydropterin synthase-related protein [Candidatus Sumerlaeota bacterium]
MPRWTERRADFAAGGAALALALLPLRSFLWQADWLTQDVHAYAVRLAALADSLRDGQWLGRWCADLDRGYGYPLFSYYPPGFYLLSSFFYGGGLGIVASIKCALTLLQLLGAAGMFALGRLFFGPAGAALGAVVWAFLPYQQVNLFVRGDMAEFAALQWLPAAAWLYLLALRRRSARVLCAAALAHACLIATHPITALVATPLLLALGVWADWRERRRVGPMAFAGVALAAGLSAFYWLPALAERSWSHAALMTDDFYDYSHHFLEWPQWLNFFFWGYGPSMRGAGDGMALHLGLAPTLLFALAWLQARRWSRARAATPWPLVAASALGAALLFMTLDLSAFLWRTLPLMKWAQFPWRLLGETGFLMAWASGAALDVPLRRGVSGAALDAPPRGGSAPRRKRALVVGAFALVVLSPPWHRGGVYEQPPPISARPDAAELRSQAWAITAVDEFLPRAVEAKWPGQFPPGEARFVGADGEARAARIRGGWTIDVKAGEPGSIVLGQYWHPGWRVEREGQAIASAPLPTYGLVEFHAPAGTSRFTVRRVPTPYQQWGDI